VCYDFKMGNCYSCWGRTEKVSVFIQSAFVSFRNLQGTHTEHKTNRVNMKPEIVQTESWRYKTSVVIKSHQQNTISEKKDITHFSYAAIHT